jgi:type II secretory pathway pseudopilin PulG
MTITITSQYQSLRSRRRPARGYGLVELTLSMAIAALVVAGGVQVFRDLRDQQSAEAQAVQLTQIIQASQKTFGMVGYTGLDTCTLTTYVVPSSLWDPSNTCASGQSAHNLSGGAITFTPVSSGAGLEIVWDQVPVSQCVGIVTDVQALADKIEVSGEVRTGTPSTTPQPVYNTVKSSGGVLNSASLTEWCYKEELSDPSAPSAAHAINPIDRVMLKFTITR